MKRFYLLMMLAVMASMEMMAANPGETCSTAIPMGKDFKADVQAGKTVWYSAWTFDLPLTVMFAPEHGSADPAPIVEMDFSCTSGYYEDSILCSLFCKTSSGSGIQIELPHKPSLSTKTLDDGTFVYYLSLGKQYRDLLLQVGISYNVEVYVKVTYQSAGKISLAPDDLFSNCVDGAKFMHINDTVQVASQDKKRHVIVPYVQWQEDTIIYKWTGTQPCTMAVANTCDFDPTDNTDGNIIQYVPNIQPGDSVKTLATNIYKWVHNPEYKNEAGMYFAKFYSDEPGEVKIVKAPRAPARGNATILRLGSTYSLNANETGVFAIPKSWNDEKIDSKFNTPTAHLFSMVVATDPDFAEEHILKQYNFEKVLKGRWVGIHSSELKSFWTKTTEQYLYVRFVCSEATTVTPSEWQELICNKEVTINNIYSLDTTFTVKRASTGGYYKMNYCRYVGGDLTFKFSAKKKCSIYVATDCAIEGVSDDPNILYYKQLTTSVNTATVPAEEVASWAERLDEEGYIFMRFHHTESIGTYKITLSSTAPADTDPTYPAATIAVVCEGTKVVVNVSEAQEIVIVDESGDEKSRWDAEPGTPHELDLPNGKYTLQGKNEKITLNL